jgi:predicted dehydrogenase
MFLGDQLITRKCALKVGNIHFIRYTLSIYPDKNKMSYFEQIADFIVDLVHEPIRNLYFTADESRTAFLITMEFESKALVNIFLNFNTKYKSNIRKVEVSGTNGLIVYDSTVEQAFQSDFLFVNEEEKFVKLKNDERVNEIGRMLKSSQELSNVVTREVTGE